MDAAWETQAGALIQLSLAYRPAAINAARDMSPLHPIMDFYRTASLMHAGNKYGHKQDNDQDPSLWVSESC